MFNFLKNIFRPKYDTLNQIEILEKNILHNLRILKNAQPDSEIFPVLKSNAYGHGIKEICNILSKTDVKIIAVDSFPEAQIAYKNFHNKVLIIGEAPISVYKYFDFNRTEFCVYNIQTLKHLASLKKKISVHLFVNTGMNREGIKDLKEFLEKSREYLNNIEITGFCSHLASADEVSDLNKKQEKRFLYNLNILNQYKIFPKWIHLGNSAGAFILNNKKYTAFRIGLAFYGYNPFDENHSKFKKAEKLKPALQVMSKVVSVQKINKGDTVSYNEVFKASKKTNIATIPFGYCEGINRKLSNKAIFYINDKPVKIAGNVCMNLTSLDCGDNKVKVGDNVEIISCDSKRENSLFNISRIEDTIPYEVLVKFKENIRRRLI